MNILISNKRRLVLLFFAIILLFTNCVREEIIHDVEITETTQPVVICAISPGDSIELLLIRSTSVSDNKPYEYLSNGIYDAEVKLYDNNSDSLTLTVANALPIYKGSQKEFKIRPGKQYWLEITLKNDHKIRATTVVPKDTVKWDEFIVYGERKEINEEYNVETLFKNIIAKWIDEDDKTKVVKRSSSDTENDMVMHAASAYLDDYVKQTACCKILEVENLSIRQTRRSIDDMYDHKEIHHFYLITLNEDLKAYLRVDNILYNNHIDLVTEYFLDIYRGVIPEYNNIDGGIGVFGAYHITDQRIVE